MSIIYCEKHDRRWDSDFLSECPLCEHEPPAVDVLAEKILRLCEQRWGRAAPDSETVLRDEVAAMISSSGDYVLASIEPHEKQWIGLARSIMMWMDMSDGPKLPRELLAHLRRSGVTAPKWLLDEPEMKALDHSMSKGGRCVLIYKAMLYDMPKP